MPRRVWQPFNVLSLYRRGTDLIYADRIYATLAPTSDFTDSTPVTRDG